MGLVLLPLFLVYAGITLAAFGFGMAALWRDSREQPRRWHHRARLLALALVLALGALTVAYLGQRGQEVYVFELLLLVHALPLALLVGPALVLPRKWPWSRAMRSALNIGTVFLMPLNHLLFTPATGWLGIATHY